MTAPKLTKMGATLMTIIGKQQTSYFDGGVVEDSGIWHEALTGETAGAEGMPKTPTGVANVITKLVDDGYLHSDPAEGEDGAWVYLTKLGADTANSLAAGKPVASNAAPAKTGTEIITDTIVKAITPKPADTKKAAPAKKAAAKKAPAKKASAPKLSTDTETIPTDPAELRTLIKITRDRRWRAGRRDDAALVAEMTAKLDKLTAAAAQLKGDDKPAKAQAKAAPAKKAASKPAAKKTASKTPAKRTAKK